MKHFKPHLHLSKMRGKNFELSVIISVKEGYHLKKLPTPVREPRDKKHLVVFEFEPDDLATASIIDTRIPLTQKDEIKVEVQVEVLDPGPLSPSGKSSAHYGDPDKETK
jgi:hypothetical protein